MPLANGGQISGATGPALSVIAVQTTNAGPYLVIVSNTYGSVTSAVAVLSVGVPGGCVLPVSGLVGWWPGDGDARDLIGANPGPCTEAPSPRRRA